MWTFLLKKASFSWGVFRQELTKDKYRINSYINGKISHFVKYIKFSILNYLYMFDFSVFLHYS